MRAPKGFGKNYFTFAAILAHSVEIKIQNIFNISAHLCKFDFSQDEEELEESDPTTTLCLNTLALSLKPCHCNCFYNHRSKLSLKLNLFIPRCPYYDTYFAFRRTGVHPPLNFL